MARRWRPERARASMPSHRGSPCLRAAYRHTGAARTMKVLLCATRRATRAVWRCIDHAPTPKSRSGFSGPAEAARAFDGGCRFLCSSAQHSSRHRNGQRMPSSSRPPRPRGQGRAPGRRPLHVRPRRTQRRARTPAAARKRSLLPDEARASASDATRAARRRRRAPGLPRLCGSRGATPPRRRPAHIKFARPTGAFVAQTRRRARATTDRQFCAARPASTASVGSADLARDAHGPRVLAGTPQIHGPRQGQPRVVRCRTTPKNKRGRLVSARPRSSRPAMGAACARRARRRRRR